MGQVPDKLTYLLIGRGRLARHMAFYMESRGLCFAQWNRHDHSTADLTEKLKHNSLILLAIPDDEIQCFYDQFKNHHSQFVHFSGAFHHREIFGFHPLMTFGYELYDLPTYEEIHIVGTATPQDFAAIFPQFNNTYHQIFSFQKPLYHSLCVLSGNGTTLLWSLVNKELTKLGLPDTALNPYLKRVSQNILERQKGRWTGPWYRGDKKTTQENTQALAENALQNLYVELAKLSQQGGEANEKHH